MKNIVLLHNPSAGDECHSKEKLIHQLEEEGYSCTYFSTKEKGWEKIPKDTELVVIAGGDGTIRKVLLKFFSNDPDFSVPFALLPLGTANNISKTLGVEGKTIEIIRSWQSSVLTKIDLGNIEGAGVSGLFIESFGAGIFPRLMKEMKRKPDTDVDPEEHLLRSLEALHARILSDDLMEFSIKADGEKLSGDYLLVEIMNTRSIGPNLLLAPDAHPGDGQLEITLIPEEGRTLFAEYVSRKMHGMEDEFPFKTILAKKVELKWNGKSAHTDDKMIDPKPNEKIILSLKRGAMKWLLPKNSGKKESTREQAAEKGMK